VLALTASSLAAADALVNVKTETVNYEDLRLTSPVGVAVLYGRLRIAAERACAPLDNLQLAGKARYRSCFDDAMAKAVTSVNHPGLTQYYESKRGAAAAATAASAPLPSVSIVAKAR
jgi:UrcA family protein